MNPERILNHRVKRMVEGQRGKKGKRSKERKSSRTTKETDIKESKTETSQPANPGQAAPDGGFKNPNKSQACKKIQCNPIGGVLDCIYTNEKAWIFNPSFLKSLD